MSDYEAFQAYKKALNSGDINAETFALLTADLKPFKESN